MAKRKPPAASLPLFDVIAVEENRDLVKQGDSCRHPKESKTDTWWPEIRDHRMTWTCNDCGHVRGRC